MNFSIEYIHENDLSITRLTDNNTKTIVDIIPQHGSILHAFTIQTPDGPLNVIDNYPDKKTILQQLPVSFKSAKLSPFACRVNMGRYSWSDTIYEFPNKFIDGSAIHGLLSDQSFTVVNQFCTEEKASVHLQYEYNRTDPGYPFNYTCEIIYSLFSNNTLQLETRITNKDTTPIPIADGWHPYFTLGGKINAYELQFTSDTMLEFNKALIPTGLLIPNASFKTAATLARFAIVSFSPETKASIWGATSL